jgi:Mrp family chromosome partitioning ATPase
MTPAQTIQLGSQEEAKIIESVFLKNAAAKKSVIFTSPDRRSGCSWVVAKLARSLAKRVPGTVCVVDANLRWPALHDMLWLDNTRGLLQAIEEASPIRSYVQRIHDSNLWVLPSGGSVADSHGLLASEAVEKRFAELKREFEFVLIDTIAMKVSPDAGLIGRWTDGAVLVLAANSTTRESSVNTKIILEAAHVPVAGAILNKRTYPIPDKIYQYL